MKHQAMMIPNNNLSVLPFYSSIEQQNARKWWVYGRIYPLFTPANMLLPFQIMRRHKVLGALDERIPAEYIYRQSDPRLGNGPIQITKILGNTLVWNQHIQNADFVSTDNWNGSNLSVSDNVITTVINGPSGIYQNLSISPIAGHYYYLAGEIKTNDNSSGRLFIVTKNTASGLYVLKYGVNDTFVKLSAIKQCSVPQTQLLIGQQSAGTGVVLQIKNVRFIDLTLMFGAGNEPTSIEDFERDYKYIIDNPAYNESALINNAASGIETKDADNNVTSYLQLNLNSFQVKDAQGITSYINGLKKAGSVYDEIVGNHYTQRVGVRAYQSGDESTPSYITDGTNTYYPLDTPLEYEIISNYPGNFPIYYGYLDGTEEVEYTETTLVAPIRYEATPYRLLLEFKIFKADGTELADYTEQMNRMLAVKTIDDIDVLVYAANIPFTPSFPNGQYYAVMSDGLNVWYSEVLTAVNDIQPYLKIEWWDYEDFVMDAGTIVYKEPRFKNVLYLDSDLAKPEYTFEEEGENRDGYFFPIKQISEKHYRFRFFASEYLLDVMRLIRMADNIVVTYHGQTYRPDTFLITPEWESNGDIASVEAEFDTATVAKKIGRNLFVPTGGDFNNDFNNDFDIANQ